MSAIRWDVYFNLTKGGYSIRDRKTNRVTNKDRLVERVVVSDVVFKVSMSGYQRMLREKRRRVHAWAVGVIDPDGTDVSRCTVALRYSPWTRPEFFREDTGEPVWTAKRVVFYCSAHGTARMLAEL